jgi:hypothetical protein
VRGGEGAREQLGELLSVGPLLNWATRLFFGVSWAYEYVGGDDGGGGGREGCQGVRECCVAVC